MTAAPRAVSISARQVGWAAAAGLFVGLRAWAAARVPVSGAELDGLAGAWQAVIGEADERYLGTLFQAATALLLRYEASEALPRLLVLAASLSIPVALYILRHALSEGGAMAALLFLAVDPVTLALGATAGPAGFDLPIALWLLVAIQRGVRHPAALACLGFAVATAGPLPMTLALGAGGWWLAGGGRAWRAAVPAAGGALAGIVAAGTVAADGLRVPPFAVVDAGFRADWSSAPVAELTVLYELPIVLCGVALAAYAMAGSPRRAGSRAETALAAWALAGAGYWLVSLDAANPLALASLTAPLCLALGVAGARLVQGIGPRSFRRLPVAAGLVAGALGAVLLVPGCLAVARGAQGEPLLAPADPPTAGAVRDAAVALAEGRPGGLVIHPALREAVTWPFRDSGTVVIATRLPQGDAVALWPAGVPGPPGYAKTGPSWLLVAAVEPPGSTAADLLRWFTGRNRPAGGGLRVDVYTGATP